MMDKERRRRRVDGIIIALFLVTLAVGGVAVVAGLTALGASTKAETASTDAKGASADAKRGAAEAKRAAAEAKRAIDKVEREGRERRDQTCRGDEREHLRDVRALRRTYDYLTSLTPRERRTTFNRLLLRLLPETEKQAQDTAPRFCDQPGLGLPEPDPVIPKRPKSLR